MKIIYFNGNMIPIIDPAIERLRKAGHEVIFYDISAKDEGERTRFHIRHFQMYQNLMDLAESADLLYFTCPIGSPEMFLYELRVRPNFKAKIISTMMFRGLDRSKARAQAIIDLINHPQFELMVFGTLIQDGFKWPDTLDGINKSKVMLVSEPFNEDTRNFAKISKQNARVKLGIGDGMYLLWSGSWSHIRGADLFIDAIKYLDDDIKILFHKNVPYPVPPINIDPTLRPNLYDDLLANSKNATIMERWIPEGEMAYLYKACDLCILSHRKLYAYSVSGIPNMAASARIPIIAPDFYYFNEIIRRYNVGVLYEPENIQSMVKAIHYAKENYTSIMNQARFEDSLKDYYASGSWREGDIHTQIFKRLGVPIV